MSDFEFISYEDFNKTKTNDVESTNYGEVVCCDFCNLGEGTMGGVVIWSNAVCGDCCEKNDYYKEDFEYKDEISVRFDMDKTFKQNVLEYRKNTYGTSDAIITIIPF